LHYAARLGKCSILKTLIERGLQVDKTEQEEEMTCLFYAIKYQHTESVRRLLNAGANVNHKTKHSLIFLDFVDFDNFSEELWALLKAAKPCQKGLSVDQLKVWQQGEEKLAIFSQENLNRTGTISPVPTSPLVRKGTHPGTNPGRKGSNSIAEEESK